jgi:hypothetical protein
MNRLAISKNCAKSLLSKADRINTTQYRFKIYPVASKVRLDYFI